MFFIRFTEPKNQSCCTKLREIFFQKSLPQSATIQTLELPFASLFIFAEFIKYILDSVPIRIPGLLHQIAQIPVIFCNTGNFSVSLNILMFQILSKSFQKCICSGTAEPDIVFIRSLRRSSSTDVNLPKLQMLSVYPCENFFPVKIKERIFGAYIRFSDFEYYAG